MSLRQMKKLQNEAQQKKPEEKPVDEDSEEEEEKPKAQKIKNAFELFQADDNDDDDEDQEEQENEDKPKQSQANKKKKNKKKAKKGQGAAKDEQKDKDIEERKANEMDEFDKALEEFREESKEKETTTACLDINTKALDYNKELAKFFKNAKLTDKGTGGEGRNAREARMIKHMKNNRNTKNFKNYKLVYCDTTHMFNPERFACEMIGHNEYKARIFALQPTKKYQELQEAYESVKNTNDPNNLAEFTRSNPFHADALFDVAELLRMQGDYKQVNQILEQILFLYEDSFSYECNIFEEDDVLLSFDENQYSRTFFVALNRFMDVLGKKGCYKSAFEYNKFLVKLNPYHDPVGGLLSLDYNAISSQNYDFLIDFPHKFGQQYYRSKEFSLIYLPNYLHAVAMAKFLKLTSDENIGVSKYAAVTMEDFNKAIRTDIDPVEENANVNLLHAILLFPSVILGMAEAVEYSKQNVSLGGDAFTPWQKKGYKDILGHKLWEQGKHEYIYPCMNINNNADIEGINKVIEIYIERSKILWKNNKVIIWVKSCLGFILNQVEQGWNYEEYMEGLFTAEFKYKVPFEISRYKGLSRANFSDRVERIDFNNIPDVQGRARNEANYNPVDTNSGLLNLIFGSLMPWNHVPNEARNRRHDPDDVEIEEEEF